MGRHDKRTGGASGCRRRRSSWRFSKSGFPLSEIKAAWRLMENTSLSSDQVESVHSAARMTMKSHRECRAERMRGRSLVLQSQPLFRQEEDERQLVVIGRLLRVLSQKMLQRLNGKSVYFRNLSSLLKANKLEGRSMELHMHSGIMATHWQQWNCMTLECRSVSSTSR